MAHFVFFCGPKNKPRRKHSLPLDDKTSFLIMVCSKSTQALTVFAIKVGGSEGNDHCVTVSGWKWALMAH